MTKTEKNPNAELVEIKAQIEEQTQALAEQLKYTGSIHPEALIEGIKGNKQSVNQQLFQMGARLALLKEQTPHGEFEQKCKQLGLERTLVNRTINAAVRLSNVAVTQHLDKLNKTQIFELLVLEDEEIQQLSEDGSVRGIELDEIDRMSCSELRKRLRDAKADSEAKDELLAKNAQNLQKLQKENIKAKNTKHLKEPTPDEALKSFKTEVSARFIDTASRIESDLVPAIEQLFEYGEEHQIDVTSWMYEQVKNIEVQLSAICDEYALQPDFTLNQEVDGE